MSRIDQLNSLFARELSRLLAREIFLDNGLITITSVDCSPDLKHAKVGFSVLPPALTAKALKLLRRHSRLFNGSLKKKLTLKFIPRFFWVVDHRPERASKIEETLKELGF